MSKKVSIFYPTPKKTQAEFTKTLSSQYGKGDSASEVCK